MNERIRNILTLIIKKPEIKMAELTKQLNLTRRQINYAISQFNEELAEKKLTQIERNHAGDFLIPLEVVKFFGGDFQGAQTYEIYSENERWVLLVMQLITNTDYVSLDHLTDLTKVSKTTTADDLKHVQWLLGKYYLQLTYDRLNGYQVLGSEHRVLQMLSDLVKQNAVFRNQEVREILAPTVSEETTLYLIHSMEQMLHLSYSDESIDYLQATVRFLLERGGKKADSLADFFEGTVKFTAEYKMLLVLANEMQWRLNSSYLQWLALLFLTSNIFEKKTTQIYDADNQLQQLIQQMVENFQNQTLIVIDDRENFERRLLSHLRPACFRIKYNLTLGAYSLDSLIQDTNHGILTELMKELILPTENWLGKAFPTDELDLLSYYFGFQLTNQRDVKAQKRRAVVICTNGVIVSKLMRENLKKLFPELHFLASFSVRDFYQFNAEYDLAFTTTPLDATIPQFIIDPIMTYKEQISLRYRVLKELGLNEVDQSVDQLLTIIQKYAQITQYGALKEAVEYFLLSEKPDSPLDNFKTLPTLTYYLKPHYIRIVEEALTWEEAVELACQPLLMDQIVTPDFVLDCQKQIRSMDYAGYLGSQMCIPHTTSEHGVLRDGVSLLILKRPVEFPQGQKINFILPLSFYDLTRHLRTVNQIADISSDQDSLQALLEKSDEKSVYQLIRQLT